MACLWTRLHVGTQSPPICAHSTPTKALPGLQPPSPASHSSHAFWDPGVFHSPPERAAFDCPLMSLHVGVLCKSRHTSSFQVLSQLCRSIMAPVMPHNQQTCTGETRVMKEANMFIVKCDYSSYRIAVRSSGW